MMMMGGHRMAARAGSNGRAPGAETEAVLVQHVSATMNQVPGRGCESECETMDQDYKDAWHGRVDWKRARARDGAWGTGQRRGLTSWGKRWAGRN